VSVIAVIGGILLRNPRVKQFIDDSVSAFIDGFTGKGANKEKTIVSLKYLVQQMHNPEFDNSFDVIEDYFGFLLTVISQSCRQKEQPLVLADFYATGYLFYFPLPRAAPELIEGSWNGRLEDGTGRAIQTAPDNPYHFYALPARGRGAEIHDQLKDWEFDSGESLEQMNDWRRALAKRTRLLDDDIVAVQAIGKSTRDSRLILVASQDPSGKEDIPMKLNKTGRATIARALEDLLNSSAF
jgi:hypothetical protein